MIQKAVSLIGIILGILAATIGAYATAQLLMLSFLDPPPGVTWEEEKRDLIREGLWVVYLSPLIGLFVGAVATPALMLLHYYRRTDCLSYAAAGAVTGFLLASNFASHRVEEVGMLIWVQGAAMGASGALIFWVVLRLYTSVIAFPAWFARVTDEGPPGETWLERVIRANRDG